ncbi:hypothetical protein M8C21_010642, partial [Ambrosia artemisiifolia]
DERCDMELDETDPTIWLKLEAATNDYIKNNSSAFKNVCEKLLQNHNDEKFPDNLQSQQLFKAKRPCTGESRACLGWRRNVLLVKASNSVRNFNHVPSLDTFCCGNGIKLSVMDVTTSETLKPVPETSFPSPFASPLFSPSNPHLNGKRCPLEIPSAPRQLSVPIRSLHDRLQNSPHVGVVHLALQNDTNGSVLSWESDVFVIAEPGELADKFLQNVKCSFQSMLRGRRRRHTSHITNTSTIADLVACTPCFQIGVIVHRYIGRQTQVNEDNQEIGAYMFRRTVPSMHLSPADVRWMVGGWRDRIIIYSGLYGPFPALIKAFLDSGAKAVICPTTEPKETHTQSTSSYGSCDYLTELQNAKFEIGVEEHEEDDLGTTSPVSEWENMTERDTTDAGTLIWDDDDEEELSKFICEIYESIHLRGERVDFAVRQALASHRSIRYSCHLPRMI